MEGTEGNKEGMGVGGREGGAGEREGGGRRGRREDGKVMKHHAQSRIRFSFKYRSFLHGEFCAGQLKPSKWKKLM